MIYSMTGFGRAEHEGKCRRVVVEMKSVNHRYMEVFVKLPRQYVFLEEAVRRYINSSVSRGRFEVHIKLENTVIQSKEVQVDKEIALAYHKALKVLAEITGMPLQAGVEQLMMLPEVLKIEDAPEDLDLIWQDILPALEKALALLVEMRAKEGEKLWLDLCERLHQMYAYQKRIKTKSPQVVNLYREKLHGRLKELLGEGQVDESRLAMEVALFADKCSIDEELVRMESHLSQFEQILKENNPIGRKLDFLLQEMNREINTIASKANDLEITKIVVEAKSELEKIREQVQNIE